MQIFGDGKTTKRENSVHVIFFAIVGTLIDHTQSVYQRYDGYYNNLQYISRGSARRPFTRNITTAYSDETYLPSGAGRPNARMLSNELFKGYGDQRKSQQRKTAFFAFFSSLVQRELTSSDDITCPVELIEILVPKGDPDFDVHAQGDQIIPYERIAYDKSTGQSPNNPRRQVNKASSYIDGSFIYGNSRTRIEYLWDPKTGKLACSDMYGNIPLLNDVRLPYQVFPTDDGFLVNQEHLWRLGDTRVFETPFLLSLNLMFYRYHNKIVDQATIFHPDWSKERLFQHARRWVISILQKVVMYDWLPLFVNSVVKSYRGYNPEVNSQVTDLFDAVAVNYLLTLLPSVVRRMDGNCNYKKPIRLCNSYWKGKDIVTETMYGTIEILRGMIGQMAEADDMYVVEDLRSKFYGPLFYSRQDAVALTIMKGRDYGLPDYNTARASMGLRTIKTFDDFYHLNPELNQTVGGQQAVRKLKQLHMNRVDMLDIFVGGMMETRKSGPGALFSTIILDQMYRIRDGDRFWFENTDNGLLTAEDVQMIMNTTLKDILENITLEKYPNWSILQQTPINLFLMTENNQCFENMITLNNSEMETCPNHKGFHYFSGSTIPFIIIWTSFGLLPFVVISIAYIIAKCRQRHYNKVRQEARDVKEFKRMLRLSNSSSEFVMEGEEWRGKGVERRKVELHFTSKGTLEEFSIRGKHLRTIKLANIKTITVVLSSSRKRNIVLLQLPQEYDLVIKFPDEERRNAFVVTLYEFLGKYDHITVLRDEKPECLIFRIATTKEKRNVMLEKFFKTIFKEAFNMDYDPSLDNAQLDMQRHSKDIMEVELSKDEFAEAIGVASTSDFVEHFFRMTDSDKNGYISFREFLHAVLLFSKGTCQEKLQTMFHMYDTKGEGTMNISSMSLMFRSLLQLANSKETGEEVEKLVQSFVQQAGLQDHVTFTFTDFCQIFSTRMDRLWNATFDWKGVSKHTKSRSQPKPTKKQTPTMRMRNQKIINTMEISNDMPKKDLLFEAVRENYSPLKARVKLVKHFVENYRQHIFFIVIFYGIVIGLFLERFYRYTIEKENQGFRRLMSYGISLTRGAAAAMSFSFSLILLTMCRNSITYLRSTAVNLFVPFDSHITFHKLIAWTALFFTAIHVIGYSFNFYHLTTLPTSFLCVFESVVLRSEFVPSFLFWIFNTMTGCTGVLLIIVVNILFVFATQTARRYIFNLFWITHKLFIILYILTLIHGASNLVQKPLFLSYFIGPIVLYTMDKIVSLSRKKTQLSIIRAENLPSDVTMLEFKRPARFEYKSGQWVRIACLSQGKDEYHPFTLTSAPHEDTLKVHIRARGPWTWNICDTFDPQKSDQNIPYPKLYLDGPYGAGQQDWYQYDVSVLVGAGIGVTPYASILKDFVYMSSINMTYKVKYHKLYFIWITESQRHFEWLIDILKEVEATDKAATVDIDIFITQFFQNFDLRTALLYIFEEHFQKMTGGRSLFTGLKATTHFGRPQLHNIMSAVQKEHPQVKKVGVFSCGPPGVTKGVQKACQDANKGSKTVFEHHFENF